MSKPEPPPTFDSERATIIVLLAPVVGFVLGAGGVLVLTRFQPVWLTGGPPSDAAWGHYWLVVLMFGGIGAAIVFGFALFVMVMGYLTLLVREQELEREREESRSEKQKQ